LTLAGAMALAGACALAMMALTRTAPEGSQHQAR
jgi:Spy/CpxP family protein refolding chaperone